MGLHLFADADFAGCSSTARSTSEVFLCVKGPDSFMGLTGLSKRQTCVSHSTPESEIVASDCALRLVGLPALQLWDALLPKKAHITFHEDNQAMIRVCETGRNPTMRHLGRTHRVDVAWLHERFSEPELTLVYEQTKQQAADIFTKAFTDRDSGLMHVRSLRTTLLPPFGPCPSLGGGAPLLRRRSRRQPHLHRPRVLLPAARQGVLLLAARAGVLLLAARGGEPNKVLLLAARRGNLKGVLLPAARSHVLLLAVRPSPEDVLSSYVAGTRVSYARKAPSPATAR